MGSNVFLSMIAVRALVPVVLVGNPAHIGYGFKRRAPQRWPWDGELMTSSHLYR